MINKKCIIIIKNESAMQGWEKMRTLVIRRPQPHTTNPWKAEREKILGDEKKEQIRPVRGHWLYIKTRQSHTIKHRVIKIVP